MPTKSERENNSVNERWTNGREVGKKESDKASTTTKVACSKVAEISFCSVGKISH
jgi:hypothetical protein